MEYAKCAYGSGYHLIRLCAVNPFADNVHTLYIISQTWRDQYVIRILEHFQFLTKPGEIYLACVCSASTVLSMLDYDETQRVYCQLLQTH
jgi:hypothetical protein